MYKLILGYRIFLCLFLCCLYCLLYSPVCSVIRAQEEITITTYYPSPYGVYDEMRVNRMSVGPNYQAAAIVDGQLIIEGPVGLGTATPAALFDIVDATNEQGTMLSISGYDNDAIGPGLLPYNIVTLTDENDNSDFVIRAAAALVNDADVRVGINTATPSATLDVQGDTNVCVRRVYPGGGVPAPCPANYTLTTPEAAIQLNNPPFYMCCRSCLNPDNNNNGICDD